MIYLFVKFGCSMCMFLSSANLICRSTYISKCFRDFEIRRVDCILNKYTVAWLTVHTDKVYLSR